MKYSIYTLGCKVNQYESEAMAEKLEENGIVKAKRNEQADICIINTCAVTSEAERKARQIIRREIVSNPGAYIIVTGCYAQLKAGEIMKIPGVSLVIGNGRKLFAADCAVEFFKDNTKRTGIVCENLSELPFEKMSIIKSERTRAYIKIEDGCESKCAYCAIKNARGPIRSKKIDEVYSEAKQLTEAGYKEIVLTGIEISGFGKDTKKGDLADLVLKLSEIKGLMRIRLGSLDPSILKPDFIDKLAKSSILCHHFHISLQSGCDKTLNAMKRRYAVSTVKKYVDYIRKTFDDSTFTADTIVGFPGESEDDFAESVDFIYKLDLLYNHIFPFSRRPGTEADTMKNQISESIKNERLHKLEKIRDISSEKVKRQFIGKYANVIFEEYKNGYACGHTDNYIEIFCKSDIDLRGCASRVIISCIKDGIVFGKVADPLYTEE